MGVVVFGAWAAVGIGLALWQHGRGRSGAERRLRKAVLSLPVLRNPALRDVEFLGVGNVGCVVSARLGEGWKEELGITWCCSMLSGKEAGDSPCESVSIKIAPKKKRPEGRLALLTEFTCETESDFIAGRVPALCPFLALGLLEVPKRPPYLIQIMPRIEGEPLTDLLARGLPNPQAALEELARVLETALYLDQHAYFSRNLDAENVIVQPDGTWVRIDYDSIRRRDFEPVKRIQRLLRLTRLVAEALPADYPARAGLLDRLQAAGRDNQPLPSTEQLIAWLRPTGGN